MKIHETAQNQLSCQHRYYYNYPSKEDTYFAEVFFINLLQNRLAVMKRICRKAYFIRMQGLFHFEILRWQNCKARQMATAYQEAANIFHTGREAPEPEDKPNEP